MWAVKSKLIEPIIGVSGIRGIVGESFTPDFLARFSAAFGVYLEGGRVVVARDTRKSGQMIKHLVVGGLLSAGCEVHDLGVVPTPTSQIMVEELRASGGLVITGSHNPKDWNALKFLREKGVYLNKDQLEELLKGFESWELRTVSTSRLRALVEESRSVDRHIAKVLDVVDVEKIKQKRFKVVVDCCNGTGVFVSPSLLEALGCEVIPLHSEPDGEFRRDPEPNFLSLKALARAVEEYGADVGFAQDPDADRLAVVSENGEILGEEYTLVLSALDVLSKRKGVVVTNYSTSRALEDVCREAGSELLRAPVGEVNVVQRMMESSAIFGGEGNGGVIDPRIHYGRDSLIGMALILELMAETSETISELMAKLPRYYTVKRKINCSRDNYSPLMEKLGREFPSGNLTLEDGIRVDWKDSWAHIRPSGTEPVVRVITEATSKRKALQLNRQIKSLVEQILASL